MRCLSCGVILTDFEATRRFEQSGAFVDMCNKCIDTDDMFPNTTIRVDLASEDELSEDYFDDEVK
jgi:hypothetical protein